MSGCTAGARPDGVGSELRPNLAWGATTHTGGARRLDVAELPRLVSTPNDAVRHNGADNDTPGMGTTLVGVAVADKGGSPSLPVAHPTNDVGRPPALPDAPAWGAPHPSATDRTP